MPSTIVKLNRLESQYDNTEFKKIPCFNPNCSPRVYASNDPRLCSAGHSGQRIVLDKQPTVGDFFTTDGLNSDINLSDYNVGYKNNSYIGIKDGSVTYYYDNDLATPFIPQLFESKHKIMKEQYIDPMGICKYHYSLIPKPQKETNTCGSCPVWLRDSQFHREDLLSKQLAKTNQNNYQINLSTSGELKECV